MTHACSGSAILRSTSILSRKTYKKRSIERSIRIWYLIDRSALYASSPCYEMTAIVIIIDSLHRSFSVHGYKRDSQKMTESGVVTSGSLSVTLAKNILVRLLLPSLSFSRSALHPVKGSFGDNLSAPATIPLQEHIKPL